MSDQTVNYARPSAAAPLLLGTAGAVTGALVAPVKKGYMTLEELLLMSEDSFQTVADKAAKLAEGETKNLYTKLVEGRTVVNKKLFGRAEIVKDLMGENGALKDFNVKNIRNILPKAKFWPMLGLAALGLFIGRIISVAKANKKNMALAQQMQAQNI